LSEKIPNSANLAKTQKKDKISNDLLVRKAAKLAEETDSYTSKISLRCSRYRLWKLAFPEGKWRRKNLTFQSENF